jgi:anthranilate phosphoribosyltransferase
VTRAATDVGSLRGELERLLAGVDLEPQTAEGVLAGLVDDETPLALRAALVTALRAKGESADELAGFVLGLWARARAVPRRPGLCVDTAGTGGDGTQSFNLSTAAALLLAALGLPVAKHGNRAVSSRTGSADLVSALGLPSPADPLEAAAVVERDGFVFLFAPHFHPALASLAALRRELGVRTIFNLLGPLVNPARPSHQLIGAASPAAALRLAQASAALALSNVLVVHGDGYDEATPTGPFRVFRPTAAGVDERLHSPEDFGLASCKRSELEGGDARANAERLERLFDGRERGPLADAVCLNAALVLLLAGEEREPRAAQRRARAALEDGRALRLLARLRAGGRA